ncbi:ferredoxin reductase [Rhodococcus erythropolis]|nr:MULTISPECIES: ferredoxin reductase [Rhodococcus erythropolis group]MCD2105340.1 ferredoxin reductase [Rhodococcus qingshengii]MCZ4524056.1 ferredoxin reductase [Rhodococcus erythropolis]
MVAVTLMAEVATKFRLPLVALFEKLVAPHPIDRYLELIDPLLTVRDLRGVVTAVHRATSDAVTLTVRPTSQWAGFEAGQFVRIGVVIRGIRETRCYSPVNSQHRADGQIELTVHARGAVSNFLVKNACAGMVFSLAAAAGEFRLPDQRPQRIVFISGGSGVTPVMSMLRTLIDENYPGDIVFLHYARTSADAVYRDELAWVGELENVTVRIVYTDQTGVAELYGNFVPDHLDTMTSGDAPALTYLCGPQGLMDSVRDLYQARGLGAQLRTEAFTAAPMFVPGGTEGNTSFVLAGISVPNSSVSLLEQAEMAGLKPEFGCRMGICFSCTAMKATGSTRNLRTGDVDTRADQPIQLCVSAAVGDVTINL